MPLTKEKGDRLLFFTENGNAACPFLSCYPRIMRATTGIAKIIELATHQIAALFPRILPVVPMPAAPTAARPLTKAISSAINPRVRHPNTSTGSIAILKKTTGIMAGIRM
jgi:hypothetical protein